MGQSEDGARPSAQEDAEVIAFMKVEREAGRSLAGLIAGWAVVWVLVFFGFGMLVSTLPGESEPAQNTLLTALFFLFLASLPGLPAFLLLRRVWYRRRLRRWHWTVDGARAAFGERRILLLRPFDFDRSVPRRSLGARVWSELEAAAFGHLFALEEPLEVRSMDQLARAMTSVGHPVVLQNPKLRSLRIPNAGQIQAEDANWQSIVDEQLTCSDAVILVFEDRPSLCWELDRVASLPLDMPTAILAREPSATWSALSERVPEFGDAPDAGLGFWWREAGGRWTYVDRGGDWTELCDTVARSVLERLDGESSGEVVPDAPSWRPGADSIEAQELRALSARGARGVWGFVFGGAAVTIFSVAFFALHFFHAAGSGGRIRVATLCLYTTLFLAGLGSIRRGLRDRASMKALARSDAHPSS